MKRVARALVASAFACLFPLSACTYTVIEGSGRSATEQREVSAFLAVDNASMLDVTVSLSDQRSVSVTCDDNLLDYIRTRVTEGKLEVYQPTVVDEPNNFVNLDPHTACQVEVVTTGLIELASTGAGEVTASGEFEALSRIKSSGAGDIVVEGLDVSELNLEVSGAGDVELSGEASRIELDSSGAGQVQGRALSAKVAEVEISGAGDAELTVTDSIDVELSGAGDLRVWGRPAICDVDTPGAGSVYFMD